MEKPLSNEHKKHIHANRTGTLVLSIRKSILHFYASAAGVTEEKLRNCQAEKIDAPRLDDLQIQNRHDGFWIIAQREDATKSK